MAFGYLTHPACLRHRMVDGHPEAPARLSVVHDRLQSSGLLDWVHWIDAPAVSQAALLRAHDARYLAELEALAPEVGLHPVDPDTWIGPHTLTAARHAAGAVVRAVEGVVSGEFQRAFCAVRPPGHHADRSTAMGFCFYNNIAIGALHALRALGLERVAVVDFDAHDGNGSIAILAGEPGVEVYSCCQRGLYPCAPDTAVVGNVHRILLPPFSGGAAMRAAVLDQWLPALARQAPQLLLVSAGFDAHREDDVAELGWADADYLWLVRTLIEVAEQHAGGRIVSSLEGGYALPALARCVEQHVRALCGL